MSCWILLGACGGDGGDGTGTAGSPATAQPGAAGTSSGAAGSPTAGARAGAPASGAAGGGAAGSGTASGAAGTASGTAGSSPAGGAAGSGAAGGAAGSGAAGSSAAAGTSGGASGAAGGNTAAGSGGSVGAAGAAGGATGAAGGAASGGAFSVTSSAVMDGAMLPDKHRCTPPLGSGMTGPNPALTWTAGPAGTMSYAITFTDQGLDYAHWTIYDIPSSVTMVAEGVPEGAAPATPMGAKQGPNDALVGGPGYYGPCAGAGTYVFEVYALDVATLDLAASATLDATRSAIDEHKIASTTLTIMSGM